MAETFSALAQITAMSREDREKVLDRRHAAWDENVEQWRLLLDAYDGSGGFLNGSYLWRFPRETDTDFETRRQHARYHNYAETLVDLYARKVFGGGVSRTTTNELLQAWWDDIDGGGTSLTDFMRDALSESLVLGHCGILADKTRIDPSGPARSDEKSRVFLTRFMPQSIVDWRLDHDRLMAVKLVEAAPNLSIADERDDDEAEQYAIWTTDGWGRWTAKGEQLNVNDAADLGLIPLSILRPKRSRREPFIGKSLFGNANILRAFFNRASEEDEVIRNQAFSLFVVSMSADGDVEKARRLLGEEVGTTRVLFVQGGTGDFKTPDMQVPGTIRANQAYLVQELYRLAHIRFNRDTLEAESAEAMRLQSDELNQMLQGIAAELTRVEREIARHWCAWMYPTPEAAERAFDEAAIQITYPREFFLRDLEQELIGWAEAIRLGLGDTVTKAIRKQAARRVLPDAPAETLAAADAEIDAGKQGAPASAADDATERLRQATMTRMQRMIGAGMDDEAMQ